MTLSVKFRYALLLIFIFSLGLSFGTLCSDKLNQVTTKPAEIKQSIFEGDMKTTVFTTSYKGCGHTISVYENEKTYIPSDGEVGSLFPGWQISGGDEELIILSKEEDGYCDNHFLAKLTEDKIIITSINNNIPLHTISIHGYNLGLDEQTKLYDGIIINSKEELVSFMEDFSS